MTIAPLGLDLIDSLTGGRIGQFDIPCPLCSPYRKAKNHRLKVLRVWRVDENFAGYSCVHCGGYGYTRDNNGAPPDPEKLNRMRAEAAERQRIERAESRTKFRWLWARRLPPIESIVETYLRECRRYTGPLPATLGFLPATDVHPPAMIAAFGMARETEPGELVINDAAVTGIHITKLKPDGLGKADTEADKLTIGLGNRSPIWLAPMNDGLGLVITEGIEDALSAHQATGLGAWAAGTAGRLPAMADAVPDYVKCVTIMVDADIHGEKNSIELAEALAARGFEVLIVRPPGSTP